MDEGVSGVPFILLLVLFSLYPMFVGGELSEGE